MSSGPEDEVSSELETQFVAQSGDEDVLWTVEEITAERGNKYKVKWAGIDPNTGKPWAQSWVTKHDCTDDLVIDWKAKKKLLAKGKKRGRETATSSRTSKQAGSSTTRSRRSTSKTTSSRQDSVREHGSLPPKPSRSSVAKRKREAELSTTRVDDEDEIQDAPPIGKRSGVKRKRHVEAPSAPTKTAGELSQPLASIEEIASRPRKKQKTIEDTLLPPISSDDEGDALQLPPSPAKATVQDEKKNRVLSVVPEEDEGDRSPPKSKGRPASARGAPAGLGGPEEKQTKTKSRDISRHNDRDLRVHVLLSPTEDNHLRPPKLKQHEDAPEKGAESSAPPIKIGPPQGVKRRKKLKDSKPPSKPGPSSTKHSAISDEQSKGKDNHEAAPSSERRRRTPLHISIPQVPPTVRPQSIDLSPGAKARLEIFDRMMGDDPSPATDLPEPTPDDVRFDFTTMADAPDTHDTFDAPPPPPSKPTSIPPKADTPNGLIVPETESSGVSQIQSPQKIISLPAIAVIAPPSSVLAQPQKTTLNNNRSTKKSTIKTAPNPFRPTANARTRIEDEAPPSSIESFPSPRRVDKGKQRAVEEDQLQSSPSEGEEDGARPKKRVQRNITDSVLKKRGKELFDQAQLAHEAEQQKKKQPKRLKMISEIINGASSSPTKGSPLVFTSVAEDVQDLPWDDLIDLSGGANSATLDTVAHSETRPLSDEKRERLRIELRQEEEESTQEAMGIYPPAPEHLPGPPNGVDDTMPPPKSSKQSLLGGQAEDGDHAEQPSADHILASIIAQASQDPRHSQTDPGPPIPENLTDSPKRRLGEALSVLNSKSEEIQRLEHELVDERKRAERLTAELAALQQSSEPTAPVRAAWDAERAQWAEERSKWENDAALWETERKTLTDGHDRLAIRLAELSDAHARAEEAVAKLAVLQGERDMWIKEREGTVPDMQQRSAALDSLGSIRGEYDESQLKWGAEKVLWAEEKTRWETERAALQEERASLSRSIDELTAAVESARSAEVSAAKDRDFFREQYVLASEFVGTVRNENTELENRVKIAEGQAQEGVAGIKALFEGRVKALQADLDRWKGLAGLLQEKDKRTNDELRLRAAQVPELIALCDRLRGDNKSLDADVRRLDRAHQRGVYQRNKLFYDILLLKRERASLRSKLAKLTRAATAQDASVSASTSAPMPAREPEPEPEPASLMPVIDLDEMDPNDMPVLSADASFDEPGLYPCMWRPQLRDQCPHVFDTKEDLERHMGEHFRVLRVQ